MQRSPLILSLCLLATGAWAQTDQYVISRQGSISVFPVYQRWSAKDAGVSFSQSAATLSAYIPMGRNMSLSLQSGGAGSGGDVPALNGLADLQAGWTYYWEPMNTIFTLGLNAPTGKRELTSDQFVTSLLFSSTLFELQVPVLGQGLNLNPGVAWVFPLRDYLMLGLAAAYQYRGPYKPRDGLDAYDPGDEVTVSTGVDYRATDVVALSFDFVFTSYAADKYAGSNAYASGNSYWINLQYSQYFREDELVVFAGYRTKSKGKTAGVNGLVDEKDRLEPGRLDVSASYKQLFNQRFSLTYLLEGRVFETTPASYAGAKVIGIGAAPVYAFASGVFIPASVKVQFGSLKGGEKIVGVEAGIGVGLLF
jgi:hypothetical protein